MRPDRQILAEHLLSPFVRQHYGLVPLAIVVAHQADRELTVQSDGRVQQPSVASMQYVKGASDPDLHHNTDSSSAPIMMATLTT